jgi:preprotein translocase subunit SecB
MTDVTPEGAPDAQPTVQAEAPGIRIIAQYIRDLSFENPRAPESLRATQSPPQVDLQVEMNAKGRPDRLFEVDLKLAATVTNEGETNFHCELVYGGLFQLNGVAEQDLEAVLLIECPRFLFPFARRIIADLCTESGFPPFLLEPIDFAGVYQAQRQRAAANADAQVGHA